jgi:glycosyltransferase involved in cell wall biosynthesis
MVCGRPAGWSALRAIVVDDGSRDQTVARLRSLLPTTPELVILRLRRNFGQTSALQAGFDRARGDVIVTLDGDLQNDPRDIPRLLERIKLGADVVSGWRVDRKDGLWLRRVPSRLANRLIRGLTGVPIHDQDARSTRTAARWYSACVSTPKCTASSACW